MAAQLSFRLQYGRADVAPSPGSSSLFSASFPLGSGLGSGALAPLLLWPLLDIPQSIHRRTKHNSIERQCIRRDIVPLIVGAI